MLTHLQGPNLACAAFAINLDACLASCDAQTTCVAVMFDHNVYSGGQCAIYTTKGDLTSPVRTTLNPTTAFGGSVYYKKFVYSSTALLRS